MRLLLIVWFAFFNANFAQLFTISGKVTDRTTNEVLVGANIKINRLKLGTTTNTKGYYELEKIPKGNYSITVSYLGYKLVTQKVKLTKNLVLNFKLSPISLLLQEATVNGKRARFRETPVAFSEVNAKQIETGLGARYITSALNEMPGVFVSPQGGGFADSRINIRGYDQTAISVMINGIPINNPENGEVYWSNWADLSDVVSAVQVQRGLSATPFSVSSIGGNVNIITNGGFVGGPELKLSNQIADGNYKKYSIAFSTPVSDKNISLIGLISRTTATGYAEQTWLNMLTYYFALSANFGKHTFQFQIMGSPQEHGQRLTPESINTWALRGLKYNSDWGYLHGNVITTHDNKFHKPSITINHNWEVNKTTFITNTLYLSYGIGGGHVPPWGGFPYDDSGHLDFSSVYYSNSTNIDTAYSTTLHRSVSALRFTYHKHYWGAFLSTIKKNLSDFTFSAGVDGNLYRAENYNTLDNLLGGDYYIGSNNINLSANKKLFTGNKVDYDADSFARALGGFFQAEYNTAKINTFINLALGTSSYNRIDYFNYKNDDPNRETGWKQFTTYTIKAGANYNINNKNNVFINVGNFSKAPLSMNVYTYQNKLFPDVKNEVISSAELGYGFTTKSAKFNFNLFYTLWNDKVLNFNVYMPDTYSFFYANIYGAKSLHKGIEGSGFINLSDYFSVDAAFTLASYKWLNDVTAYLRPEGNPNSQQVFNSKIKGLYEGNSPMTKVVAGITVKRTFNDIISMIVSPRFYYYGKYYSMFDPVTRSFGGETNIQSWRIPDFNRIDLNSEITFSVKSKFIRKIKLCLNIFNVLNAKNIIQANDGETHDANSATVWYSRERWMSFKLSLEF